MAGGLEREPPGDTRQEGNIVTLEIAGLTKRYGRSTVLADVSASFAPNAVHFVMGHNGAGTSTLLRCIMGLERHEGSVTWQGERLRPEEHTITPVFDTAPAYLRLTGRQNIAVLCPESAGGPISYLDDDKLRSRVSTYSHGERMRLALMMALNSPSPILLLDEPTNGLDREAMVCLQQDLKALKADRTIVLTGHNLEFYSEVVDTVTVIHEGALHRVPPPATSRQKEASLVDIYDAFAARGTC